MLPKSPLIVQDLNDLHLDIHTIGYPNEGESLLTLLCDGDKVLFSVLTDCYEYNHEDLNKENHYNHASLLLSQLHINQIDAFIWTHPDEDHSIGIPDFLDRFDPKHEAKIILPSGLHDNMGIKQKAKDAIDYIMKYYNSKKKHEIYYVQEHKPNNDDEEPQLPRSPMSLKIKVMNHLGKEITFSYNFLLPNDDVVNRPLLLGTKPPINDYSIVYFISFNNFNFFFLGDLSRRNVKFIHPNLYQNSVFIKIPHHGSDEYKKMSDSIVPKFNNKSVSDAISTTTVFMRFGFPKDDVLKDYCRISDGVYCTSDILARSNEPYGCITARFYANMRRPEVITSGNAYCYYHKSGHSD